MSKYIDLTGQRFGRLTALSYEGRSKQYDALWRCICDCGAQCQVRAGALRGGHTQSCGCLQRERTRASHLSHGLTNSKLYGVWSEMKRRCSNSHDTAYGDYGGRGITVCEEWGRFEPFYEWARENGYQEGLTIERVNNNAGYEPSNCVWATQAVQNRNMRSNIILDFHGQRIKLIEWADSLGIPADIFHTRVRRGWSAERVLTQPVRGYTQ
jgi:hypothetical protein